MEQQPHTGASPRPGAQTRGVLHETVWNNAVSMSHAVNANKEGGEGEELKIFSYPRRRSPASVQEASSIIIVL